MGFFANNLLNSNITSIIKSSGTTIISNNTNNLNGKKTFIPMNHPLWMGIVGTYQKCALLNLVPVNIIDGSKLLGEGAKMFNEAKVWHTHVISQNDISKSPNPNFNISTVSLLGLGIVSFGQVFELVYTSDNTYFYRKQGQKANYTSTTSVTYTKTENDVVNKDITYTSTYTVTKYDNTSQVNNENITKPTINKFIENDIYQNVIIVLNMNKNLCSKSICYLKFEIIESVYWKVYKQIYVKYYNSTGLLSKQLFNFTMANSQEKDTLKNGFIRITAYQLSDYSDTNPYTIGKFKISDFTSKSKITTLYKFLEINDVYKFTFDSINIYPISISGETYKFNNNYLSIYKDGNILNNDILKKKIYSYTMDMNYISIHNEYLKFDIKSFVINIDDNEIWDNYHDFYCNITFYLKNGKTYVLPNLLFNKLNKQLIFNEVVEIKELKNVYKDIIKFNITYIGGSKSNQKIKLNDIKLSTQGNIINN